MTQTPDPRPLLPDRVLPLTEYHEHLDEYCVELDGALVLTVDDVNAWVLGREDGPTGDSILALVCRSEARYRVLRTEAGWHVTICVYR